MDIPKKPVRTQPLLKDRTNAERKADLAKRKVLFLKAYDEFGTVRGTAEAVGITRDTYRRWLGEDPEFMRSMDEAKQSFGEYLEGLALERIKNPDKGKGSDVLLMFMLNGNMAPKYRPQVAMSEEAAKDLLLEWRKAVREPRVEAVTGEPLPTKIERTLTEVLERRGDAHVEDEEDDDSHT